MTCIPGAKFSTCEDEILKRDLLHTKKCGKLLRQFVYKELRDERSVVTSRAPLEKLPI